MQIIHSEKYYKTIDIPSLLLSWKPSWNSHMLYSLGRAWDEYITLETRLHTKPGKKEHGGRGEGRRESPALGDILR